MFTLSNVSPYCFFVLFVFLSLFPSPFVFCFCFESATVHKHPNCLPAFTTLPEGRRKPRKAHRRPLMLDLWELACLICMPFPQVLHLVSHLSNSTGSSSMKRLWYVSVSFFESRSGKFLHVSDTLLLSYLFSLLRLSSPFVLLHTLKEEMPLPSPLRTKLMPCLKFKTRLRMK